MKKLLFGTTFSIAATVSATLAQENTFNVAGQSFSNNDGNADTCVFSVGSLETSRSFVVAAASEYTCALLADKHKGSAHYPGVELSIMKDGRLVKHCSFKDKSNLECSILEQ